MNQKPILQHIEPRKIRTDLDTQAREKTCEETVSEYAEAMEEGKRFPPLVVFYDVESDFYVLADGFHRLFAHLRARPNDPIEVEQYLGNIEDARWFSIGANKSHGLKRTNEDKRNAVEMALLHPQGARISDSLIARHVGVTHPTVLKVRKMLEADDRLEKFTSRVGADGRTYNVSKIGKKPDEPKGCGNCGRYKSPRCTMDGETHSPLEDACPDYIVIPEPEPEPVEEEENYTEEDLRPYEPKPVSKRPGRRKTGEYAEIALCLSNTDLAAVEIRNLLGENYLAALTQSGMKVLKGNF